MNSEAGLSRGSLGLVLLMLMPGLVFAQQVSSSHGLHGVLQELYDELMPICSSLASAAQGIAGLAALWCISSRIWGHLSRSEPIDFYPLFRPFVLGFCISIFPMVLALVNGVMSPLVQATSEMVGDSNLAIEDLLARREQAIEKTDAWQIYQGNYGLGDRDRWYRYSHDGANPWEEGMIEGMGNDVKFAMSKLSFSFRNSVKEWMSEVLSVVFQAAALCIDTLRTFQLVVLSILGPIVFGLAAFDGFRHSLSSWFARYINVFLWLPVANIFGSIIGRIQQGMLKLDLSQIEQAGDSYFSSTDAGYLIFLIMGIVGYLTVPSVSGYIVSAAGNGGVVTRGTSSFNGAITAGVAASSYAAGLLTGTNSVESAGQQPETRKPSEQMENRLKGD